MRSEEVRQLWQEVKLLEQRLLADSEAIHNLKEVCTRQEQDLASLLSQHQEVEHQLYKGNLKSSKEIEKVRMKSDKLQRSIHDQEEMILDNLEHCEALTSGVSKTKTEINEKKRQHNQSQVEAARENAKIADRLADIDNQVQEAISALDPSLYRQYQDLSRKVRPALAKVINGVCGGCRRNVPMTQLLQSQQVVMYCDNCGRILLIPD